MLKNSITTRHAETPKVNVTADPSAVRIQPVLGSSTLASQAEIRKGYSAKLAKGRGRNTRCWGQGGRRHFHEEKYKADVHQGMLTH